MITLFFPPCTPTKNTQSSRKDSGNKRKLVFTIILATIALFMLLPIIFYINELLKSLSGKLFGSSMTKAAEVGQKELVSKVVSRAMLAAQPKIPNIVSDQNFLIKAVVADSFGSKLLQQNPEKLESCFSYVYNRPIEREIQAKLEGFLR